MSAPDPEGQLAGFLAKFTPDIEATGRAVIDAMRRRLPGARVAIYDNYNALAVGFAAGARMADVVFSIAVFPRWVSLFLVGGQTLDDPHRLLKGSGNTVRHIVQSGAGDLDDPRIEALMAAALELKPIPTEPRGEMVVKSISAKQRPRRPAQADG